MSPRTLLVSTRNSAYQVLESLRSNRQKRHRTRTFLLEGVQPITRALAHGWSFEAVIHAQEARLSPWAAEIVARCQAPIRYELSRELLQDLSGKDGGLGTARRRPHGGDDLARIPVERNLLAVVIDSPSNPGNLGTLVRSCDALGAHGVIVTGHAADLYDPATITASRGSLFAIPVVRARIACQLSSAGSTPCGAGSGDAWWWAQTRRGARSCRPTTSRHRRCSSSAMKRAGSGARTRACAMRWCGFR